MRLGVVFPQTEIGPDPGGVRAYVEAVAEIGFDHVMAYDHVLGADPAGHPGFSGSYTSAITAAGINPLPVQRPIPIWMGGFSARALERIARLADGFFPGSAPPAGGWAETIEQMREVRRQAGRDPGDLGIEPRIQAGSGNPDDWRQAAGEWKSLGATHLAVNTMGGGLDGAEAHSRRLAEVKGALGDL